MTSFQIGLLIFVAYLAVYSIVNRICECFEKRSYFHAFGEYTKGGLNEQSEDQERAETED